MQLPQELEDEFWQEMQEYEEEIRMPYISTIERMANKRGMEKGMAQGLLVGIKLGLKLKFGDEGLKLFPEISKIDDVDLIKAIYNEIETASTLDDLRRVYQ